MKQILTICLLASNALFLTGCLGWKKKQVDTTENTVPIEIDGNLNSTIATEISFIENNPDYILTPGKTIFDDVNNEGNTEETLIYNEETPISENNNCLNNFIIQEEIHSQNINQPIIIEKNKTHISTVLFDFDKSESIRSEYEKLLDGSIAQIQLALDKNPNINIIIEGHACNSCGSERYNLELSNQRAITIKNKIVKKTNINPEKLSVFGCGTSHLIVHGGRYEQAPNRRVEIFMTHN
jgi:outer membrane protein OmpA-like peptidoglycan-associated protein